MKISSMVQTLFIVSSVSLMAASCAIAPADQPTPTNSPPPPTNTPAPLTKPVRITEMFDLANNIGPAYSQDWSPDGQTLAVAGFGEIKLWDVGKSFQEKILSGHTDYIWGVKWSPVQPLEGSGGLLASASQDGTVRIWEAATLTQIAVLDTGWAMCVDWSPDGSNLAVGTVFPGTVQIWDTQTWKKTQELATSESSPVISTAWSPEGLSASGGRLLAAGLLDGSVMIWDAATSAEVHTISGYTAARSDTNGLAWSPVHLPGWDRPLLATAHQDGILRVWDPTTWQPVREIRAHQGWARGVSWSPDGLILLSSGEDKRAALWSPQTGEPLGDIKHNYLPVWSVAWSPDGSIFSSGSGAYENQRAGVAILWQVQEIR